MNSRLSNYLALLLVLIAQLGFAQSRSVTGTVTDNNGLPLPGVSILAKGTSVGAQTDIDGNFSIIAAPTQVLIFSYVGMKQQEIIASSTTLSIKMADNAIELEGVVLTALGIKREKKSLGYSSQEVQGKVISDAGQTNALGSLSGNVAGLQITAPSTMGGSTRIILRGIGSVSGENRPLIVVDGIPLDNGNFNDASTQRGAGGRDYGDAASDINPNDIESVTVLKGGPASALYGSRAGNGAILYTTKSAKSGKTEITFNTGVTLESVYILPTLQNEYGGGSSNTFQTAVINGQTYNIADYATDASWGPKYDQNLRYLPWNAFDPEFADDFLQEKSWVAPRNGVREFFDTGVTRNNTFAISKSFESGNIRFSYGNSITEGVVPNSKLQKNTFNLNSTVKLSEKLKIESLINFTQTDGFNRPEVGYGDNSLAQKFFHFGQRQLDYNELKAYKLANGNQRTWNRTAFDDATPNYSDNPYWTLHENTSQDKRNRLYGNAKLTYNFTPDLYAVGNIYLDTYSFRISERVAVGSQAQSSYSESTINLSDINYEGRLHYNKNFGDFSINTFAGVNRRSFLRNTLEGSTVGGLVLPNLYNFSNSSAQSISRNSETTRSTNSVYGFASVGYKDFLFVEATNRNDWFSTVTESSNYSSVTGSFVFSTFLKDFTWLSFGKLRGGWAQTGNDTDAYALENYKDINQPFNGDPRYSNPRLLNNPNLIPEAKETVELGIETRMFSSRLNLDVSLYRTRTNDLITPITLDPASGFTAQYFNSGTLENKGIEITLNASPIKTEDFGWDVTWNFSKNENTLLSLKEGTETLLIAQAPFRTRILAEVGQPYGQIYGTDYVYDDGGNRVIQSNGQYLASGQKSLGSIVPDYNMGLRNSVRYKNFNLSFLIDRQKGGSYFSMNHMFGSYSGMLTTTTDNGIRENGIVLDGVQADGSVNTVNLSAINYGDGFFSTVDKQNVFDADYFKLREVTLSYSLPSKMTGPFAGITITAFGRNLATWGLDWKGMDPEMASYGSGNIQGIDGGSLPSTRTYGMNVQFKF
jgi:TonB-linked SusC/RagA family outer membrane protein